jgi:hypothetical protein
MDYPMQSIVLLDNSFGLQNQTSYTENTFGKLDFETVSLSENSIKTL